MRLRRKSWHGLLAAVLAGSLVPVGFAAQADAAPPTGGTPPTESASHLVLITGDRVTLNDTGSVRIDPAENRTGIRFATYRDAGGHVHVVPSDAENLIGSGKLDANLFDVTALAAYGYDSARGGTPMIVQYGHKAAPAKARERFTRGGARFRHDLPSLRGAAVESSYAKGVSLWTEITKGLRDDLGGVWLDRKLSVNLDRSVPQVGAPAAWAAGLDGTGTKIAVIDTGIDATHPDLAGKVIAEKNFTTEADDRDLIGHGTHVASIAAGTGAASGGAYRGVAPGASLLDGKVCVVGNSDNCQESAIVAGLQWAVEQGADVVNVSLGGPDTAGVDPMEEAINTLTAEHGTLFVVSAGNSGPGEMTVESPGTAAAALTVGSVTEDDSLAGSSSQGPRIGDTAIKPEITAPGQDITAANSSTALNSPPGYYVAKDGTSMAAPHVAGAAAILTQRHPAWTATQLKSTLMGSADPHPSTSVFEQGAGRLNIARGFQQSVLADPPSLSLGRQQHPHDDDPVLDRTVTYRNSGSSPVTLNLTVTSRDPDGAAAQAGMFRVSQPTVTVPAGGTAAVTFTADTRVSGPEGHYGGTITATADGNIQVVTPYAVDRAIAGGEITFRHLDSTGEPAGVRSTILFSLDGGQDYYLGNGAEPLTTYIRQGSYFLQSWISDPGENGRDSILIDPNLRIDGNQTITLDARTARPVNLDVTGDPHESQVSIELGYLWRNTDGTTRDYSNLVYASKPFAIGQIDPAERAAGMSSYLNVTLAHPGTTGDFFNSPKSYHLVERFNRHVPTGFTKKYSTASLARVNARLAESAPNTQGFKAAYPVVDDRFTSSQFEIGYDLPVNHTEYYTAGSGLRWYSTFRDFDPALRASTIQLASTPRSYTAGTTVTEGWNEPVIGPAYGTPRWPTDGVFRTGDTIHLDPRLFGDGSGHSGLGAGNPQYTLRRNGAVIANNTDGVWPDVTVPSNLSTYRLEGTVTQPAPAELSTRISAAWTFRSKASTVRLPLWTVSFRPTLNAARAGRSFSFPATLAAQPGSTPGQVRSVTVHYSTNDGATWSKATVSGSGVARTVSVKHPNKPGFVSLRATVTDSAGNSVEQTVIRAYKIAP